MAVPSKLVARLIRSWARADARLRRAPELLGDAVAAALPQALSTTEQAAASIAIYDTAAGSRAALFDWEAAWYTATLPAPPATVLLTGAGAGVAAAALIARGFVVDAAEPAPALCARLAALPTRSARCVDHLGAMQGTPPNTRYDALIFGWGSFTCLLDTPTQRAHLEAAARVCRGPILLSFWMNDGANARPNGRLARIGRRAGLLVGRARGLPPPGDLRFWHWCGFGYVYTRAEIEALAAQIGRRVVWGVGQYPHAALMPVADPPPDR